MKGLFIGTALAVAAAACLVPAGYTINAPDGTKCPRRRPSH